MAKCTHSNTAVVESRFNEVHKAICRRRRCYECPERFTTVEILLDDYLIYQQMVKKIDEFTKQCGGTERLLILLNEPEDSQKS